ncbi:hypothetical protein K435DRAFT_965076, partial [Dendrothele bispora CBS 962.96]
MSPTLSTATMIATHPITVIPANILRVTHTHTRVYASEEAKVENVTRRSLLLPLSSFFASELGMLRLLALRTINLIYDIPSNQEAIRTVFYTVADVSVAAIEKAVRIYISAYTGVAFTQPAWVQGSTYVVPSRWFSPDGRTQVFKTLEDQQGTSREVAQTACLSATLVAVACLRSKAHDGYTPAQHLEVGPFLEIAARERKNAGSENCSFWVAKNYWKDNLPARCSSFCNANASRRLRSAVRQKVRRTSRKPSARYRAITPVDTTRDPKFPPIVPFTVCTDSRRQSRRSSCIFPRRHHPHPLRLSSIVMDVIALVNVDRGAHSSSISNKDLSTAGNEVCRLDKGSPIQYDVHARLREEDLVLTGEAMDLQCSLI